MRPIEYTDSYLLERTKEIEYTWKRLYPNGDKNNPLYERLIYHQYLCDKRSLVYEQN